MPVNARKERLPRAAHPTHGNKNWKGEEEDGRGKEGKNRQGAKNAMGKAKKMNFWGR